MDAIDAQMKIQAVLACIGAKSHTATLCSLGREAPLPEVGITRAYLRKGRYFHEIIRF